MEELGVFKYKFSNNVSSQVIDSFCLQRTRLVVKWRHLVVTFSVEQFSNISQIKVIYFSAVNKPSLNRTLIYLI